MILPELIVPSKVNQKLSWITAHDRKAAQTSDEFYIFNSRGFRDSEWPEDLENAIWCFGDSCTVGVGSPVEHTWVNLLEKETGKRCINLSMVGASNEWICKQVEYVIEHVNPKTIVVQWSFMYREETPELTNQRQSTIFLSDLNRFQGFFDAVNNKHQNIIHSFVPQWGFNVDDFELIWDILRGKDWPEQLPNSAEEIPQQVVAELTKYFPDEYQMLLAYYKLSQSLAQSKTIDYTMLDTARDKKHYDIKTATEIVKRLTEVYDFT